MGGLRAGWVLLPLALGPAVAKARHDLSPGPRSTASTALWLLWAVGLTVPLVPLPVTLTALRLGVPALAAVALWSAPAGTDAFRPTAGLAATTLVVAVAFSAPTSARFVAGASYGDERRFLLRPPGPVVLVLGPMATLASLAGLAIGPVLLLDARWVAGGLAVALGVPTTALAVRALHRLSRRWIVLVPAGLVLHDHLALAEPTLLQRAGLARIGPAAVDTDAVDFTQQARGLALEVRCRGPHDVLPAGRGRTTEVAAIEAFLCSPNRPDVVLGEAGRRRLPVS